MGGTSHFVPGFDHDLDIKSRRRSHISHDWHPSSVDMTPKTKERNHKISQPLFCDFDANYDIFGATANCRFSQKMWVFC